MSDFANRFLEAVDSSTLLVEASGSHEGGESFAQSVAAGLSLEPRQLHCRFLYDAEGSRLFEAITEQPEYYPTRTEAAVLAKYAGEIRAMTGPVTLVELGSGYSVKTEHLLSAYSQEESEFDYVPVDVSI
ncbi:MAG: L-histidine N(alpha)-methyltransferase, partial [Planctomycetota bacterium]